MNVTKFLGNYLKAKDLPPNKEFLVTITSVVVEEIGKDDKKAPHTVLQVREFEQGIVLRKTSLSQIITSFGGVTETDEWKGRQIIMFHDPMVVYAGAVVGGIRFKPAPRKEPNGQTA